VPPRHRAAVPVDPAYPDYPYFLDHDDDARVRHLYGRGGRRWGRHPGFPALDDAVHVPASRQHGGARGGAAAELQPIGRLGAAAITAGVLVTAAAWVAAASDPSSGVVAVLSLAWLVGYLAGCMWLEVAHGNAVALAPSRQERRRTRSVWLVWFVPFSALWVPKRIVDDAMWTKVLTLFNRVAAHGGVIVFTAYGRLVAEMMRAGENKLNLEDGQIEEALRKYDEAGFSFQANRYDGDTLVSRQWVSSQLDKFPELDLLLYLEHGWLGQDVVACTKAWHTYVPRR